MKRGSAQLCAVLSACGVCPWVSAATDPFLLLQPPQLTNAEVQIQLLGETDVPYVIESSSDAQNWFPINTNNETASTRMVTLPAGNGPAFYRAHRPVQPLFPAAIVALQSIQLKGNNVRVDSYDSADLAHDDPTNPNEIKAGGDLYCQGDILAGNAVIHGKLKNPGLLVVATNAIIGDLDWTNRGTIQPGWHQDDYRFVMPAVTPPFTSWNTPALTSSNSYYLTAGDYKYNGYLPFPNNGDQTLVVTGGVVRLWVTGDFTPGSDWSVTVMQGATFKLYVGDDPSVSTTPAQASFGTVNIGSSTNAATFQYYGFPNNTTVIWIGHDVHKATVYAPQTVLFLGGGGSGPLEYMGACVAFEVVINGHVYFHYDEKLKRVGPWR